MLTENFIAATLAINKPSAHTSSALKDVGIFNYELQPQSTFRSGLKKSSVKPRCLAISNTHIFAAQADKAVIHVYNRAKGNQEATVPFPDKISSLAYATKAAILVIGTADGRLILWEVATGRISNSSASHLQPVSHISITQDDCIVVSGSSDSSLHVWSLSDLVSFTKARSSHVNSDASNGPNRTFSKHRTEISALDLGHSHTNTNFAISVSTDRTCYLWHLDTCQILRTLLLPAVAISATLDPADRAIYLGCEDGSILAADLLANPTSTSRTSIFDSPDAHPIQLTAEEAWNPGTTSTGPATCVALNYDGTSLLSGHQSGIIIRWDVAKQRVISDIAKLDQAISFIQILTPNGLRQDHCRFNIPSVVKPRLDLNSDNGAATIDVPASYRLEAQIDEDANDLATTNGDVMAALFGPGLSDSMLGEAIQAMLARPTGVSTIQSQPQPDVGAEVKINKLEAEIASLQTKLQMMRTFEEQQREKHLKRANRREELGQEKRQAYFTAKKQERDGDAAMKPYEAQETQLDIESDEDHINSKMDVDS